MSGGLTSTVHPLRVSTVSTMIFTKSPALLLMVDQAQLLEEEKDNRNPDLPKTPRKADGKSNKGKGDGKKRGKEGT